MIPIWITALSIMVPHVGGATHLKTCKSSFSFFKSIRCHGSNFCLSKVPNAMNNGSFIVWRLHLLLLIETVIFVYQAYFSFKSPYKQSCSWDHSWVREFKGAPHFLISVTVHQKVLLFFFFTVNHQAIFGFSITATRNYSTYRKF